MGELIEVKEQNKETQDTLGKKIYKKNNFLRNFANLMESFQVKEFFKDYIKDDYDLYIFLNLCKFYNYLPEKYTPYQKIFFLKKLIDSRHTRKNLLKLNYSNTE